METRTLIKFFFPARQGTEYNSRHTDRKLWQHAPLYATIETGWLSLNVVIFSPVMRHVLNDTKQ